MGRDRQRVFTQALHEIAEIVISGENPEEILEKSNRILGRTLNVDRTLIYHISFEENRITGLCEWLQKDLPEIAPTKGEYTSLDMFSDAFREIRTTKQYLESHINNVNKHFLANGADTILHTQLNIKSLIWYPFAFDEHGYYLFTMNQIMEQRRWTVAEISFLESAAKQISLALIKIKLLEERKKAEDALRTSEGRLHALVQTIPDLIWLKDKEGRYLSCNTMFERFFGARESDIVGKTDYDFVDRELADFFREHDRIAIDAGKPITNEEWITFADDGRRAMLETIKTPMYDDRGELIGVLGIGRDITTRKFAEQALRESEEKYRTVADFTYDWEAWCAPDLSFQYVSPSCKRITGHTAEEFMADRNLMIQITHPEDRPKLEEHYRTDHRRNQKDNVEFDFRIVKPDGGISWISHSCSAVHNEEGRWLGRRESNREITDRKRAEEKIKQLLENKELILKEVHHRIKNNMSTIKSLLTLQAGTAQEPSAVAALRNAAGRVQSMAVLYDKLYQSDGFDSMPVKYYIPSLVDEIVSNFPNFSAIKIEKTIDDFSLDSKRLQLLGIITNELLTNILKYAFTDKESGSIHLSLTQTDGRVSLVVQDNGSGMPESIDFNNTTGFGLKLVGRLMKQLHGDIRIEREKGTRIILEFTI